MEWSEKEIDTIVNGLIDNDRESLYKARLPDSFRVSELQYDVRQFNYAIEWQAKRWDRILCIDMGEAGLHPILIDVTGLSRSFNIFYPNKLFRPFSRMYMEELVHRMKLVSYNEIPGAVREYFRQNFKIFIRTRLAGVSTTNVPSERLPFKVTTQGADLRVLYSPAFLFGGGQVFGYPSTPVTGDLLPGSYIFGADGVGIGPVWESSTIYYIPNDTQATLLSI